MKYIFLFFFSFSSSINAWSQPLLQWARNMASTSTSEGKALSVDAAGNVITTGVMRGTVDFDPGAGVFSLTSAGEEDIFISKLDANGNFVWAKRIGGDVTDQGEAIATDATGNIFITGWFSTGTVVDFDPGPGVFNLSAFGIEAYVLKLDADGNFVWAKSIGIVNNSEYGKGVVIDNMGNLFITGAFYGTVDFDPGPGNFSLTAQGGSGTDIFVTKWDAATGNFIWAKQLGGSISEYPNKCCLDGNGNILITGYFAGTADFDPGPGTFDLVSAGGTDIFVCKLNNDGNLLWAKRWGGVSNDDGYGITADVSGNVLIANGFVGTFDADPGPGVSNISSTGFNDVFVCKLNAAGDFQWAKRWGANSNDFVYDIKTDAAGNVYTGGSFANTVDFDPGPQQFLLPAAGSSSLFYSKLDANGNFIWAAKLDGGGGGPIYSLYVNASNQIFSTGFFSQTIDFDPGPGVFNLTATVTDIFIHKLSQVGEAGPLPLTLLSFTGAIAANGNLLQWKTSQEINTRNFDIEQRSDIGVFQKIGEQPAAGNSSGISAYSFFHGTPAPGNNFYRLKMVDIDGQFTYSPVIVISSDAGFLSAKIFPNPIADVLQLHIQAQKSETILCNLLGADGKITSSKKFQLIKGANRFSWNIQHLAPGTYFLSCSDMFKTIKILKN